MLDLIKLVVNGIRDFFDALVESKIFYPLSFFAVVGALWISAATFLLAFGIFLFLFIVNYYFGLMFKLELVVEFLVGNRVSRYCTMFLPFVLWWNDVTPFVTMPLFLLAIIVFLIVFVANGIEQCGGEDG